MADRAWPLHKVKILEDAFQKNGGTPALKQRKQLAEKMGEGLGRINVTELFRRFSFGRFLIIGQTWFYYRTLRDPDSRRTYEEERARQVRRNAFFEGKFQETAIPAPGDCENWAKEWGVDKSTVQTWFRSRRWVKKWGERPLSTGSLEEMFQKSDEPSQMDMEKWATELGIDWITTRDWFVRRRRIQKAKEMFSQPTTSMTIGSPAIPSDPPQPIKPASLPPYSTSTVMLNYPGAFSIPQKQASQDNGLGIHQHGWQGYTMNATASQPAEGFLGMVAMFGGWAQPSKYQYPAQQSMYGHASLGYGYYNMSGSVQCGGGSEMPVQQGPYDSMGQVPPSDILPGDDTLHPTLQGYYYEMQ